MLPPVYVAYPSMAVPLRCIPIYRYSLGTDYVIDLDVVATQSLATDVRMACDHASWLEVSSDGGGSYDPLTTSAQTGVQLGPMNSGARTPIKLKVSIASGVRENFTELAFGIGT